MFEKREGEIQIENDPARMQGDATLVFIGRILSPWKDRGDCPKNMRQARERGKPAVIEINEPYRQGLDGLENVTHIVILSWLGDAPRNLIVQKPRLAEKPRGTFALRSPARPNPVGLHVARLLHLDRQSGRLEIDGIDALDQTPVVDIKPYYASTDSVADAGTGI